MYVKVDLMIVLYIKNLFYEWIVSEIKRYSFCWAPKAFWVSAVNDLFIKEYDIEVFEFFLGGLLIERGWVGLSWYY